MVIDKAIGKMGLHAYCILAHNEPAVFHRLIQELDYPGNDIYVHIDKRSNINDFQAICQYSHITFLDNRIACNWGSLSIVKAELNLFEEAAKNGPYDFYHLLSGVDIPIKNQQRIHDFLDKNPKKNFIGFWMIKDENENECSKFFHFLVYRPGGNLWMRTCNFIDRWSVKFQRRLGIRVHYPFPLYKGSQWVSLSQDFLFWLIARKKTILRVFRYTFIPDERFIQSYFMASPFADTLYLPKGEEYEQCMREIDWERGSPYTWKDEDYDYLMNSERWFARKFSSSELGLIDRILESIKDQS